SLHRVAVSFHFIPASCPPTYALSLHDALPISYLTGHTSDFGGESIELVHHGVDGVLEIQDFAANVYGDLLGEVSGRYCCRHFGEIARAHGWTPGTLEARMPSIPRET